MSRGPCRRSPSGMDWPLATCWATAGPAANGSLTVAGTRSCSSPTTTIGSTSIAWVTAANCAGRPSSAWTLTSPATMALASATSVHTTRETTKDGRETRSSLSATMTRRSTSTTPTGGGWPDWTISLTRTQSTCATPRTMVLPLGMWTTTAWTRCWWSATKTTSYMVTVMTGAR